MYPLEGIWTSIQKSADLTPRAIAIEDDGTTITYQELVDLVSRYAGLILEDAPVMIALPRSTSCIAIILAAVSKRVAYVAIDSKTPPNIAEYIAQDSGAKTLFTAESAPWFPHKVCDAAPGDVSTSLKSLPLSCCPDIIHNICYTSGTTGKPKGVLIRECSMVHILRDFISRMSLTADDSVAALTNLRFDPHNYEIFAPLMVGAKIVVARDDIMHYPDLLGDILNAATVAQATPSGWRLILASGWRGNHKLRAISGGEALPFHLAQELRPLVGSLLNCWGPTETTIDASYQVVEIGKPISIGRPVTGYKITIIDDELCVSGPGVAAGYLNLDEKTAASFVPDPNFSRAHPDDHISFHQGGDGRMYKTGDVGYSKDGEFHIIGRKDNQVKLRGYRIELDNITRVIEEVLRCPVVVRVCDDVLIGYLEMTGELDVPLLRSHLTQNLQPYEIPVIFHCMPQFPLSATDKVDTKLLPSPEQILASRKDICADMTPLEASIMAIATALISTVTSVTESIFDQGVDSIIIVRLCGRLKDAGFDVTPLTIYKNPSIRQLAQVIAPVDTTIEIISPKHVPIKGAIPATIMALMQIFGLAVIGSILVIPSYVYTTLLLGWAQQYGVWSGLLLAGVAWIMWGVTLALVVTLLKWVLLGRIREGCWDCHTWFWYRWWLLDRLYSYTTPLFMGRFRGTPVWNLWLRSLGLRVDLGDHLDTSEITSFDLISIGSKSSINEGAVLRPERIVAGRVPYLVLERIVIQDGSWIGPRAVVKGKVSSIGALSTQHLPRTPLRESLGSGGVVIGLVLPWLGLYIVACVWIASYVPLVWILYKIAGIAVNHSILVLSAFLILQPLSILPYALFLSGADSTLILEELQTWIGIMLVLGFAVTQLAYYITLPMVAASIYWILNGISRPGTIPRTSLSWYRRWLGNLLLATVSEELAVFDGTYYVLLWWRLVGLKLSPRSLCWTGRAPFSDPRLISIGADAELGNAGSCHTRLVYGNESRYEKVKIRDNGLVGIHAVMLPGTRLPHGCTLGAMSSLDRDTNIAKGTTLLFGGQQFTKPTITQVRSASREAKWVLLQITHMILSPLGYVIWLTVVSYPGLIVIAFAGSKLGPMLVLAAIPAISLGNMLWQLLALILCRWLIIPDVFRTKRVITDYFATATWYRILWMKNIFTLHSVLPLLLGSRMGNWIQRLLGAQIDGSAVVYSEIKPDACFLTVGRGSVISPGTVIQLYVGTHGNLTMDHCKIGSRVTIEPHAVVMYDTRFASRSRLASLSCAIPGQRLNGNTAGVPAM